MVGAAPASAGGCPRNPDVLGVSRVLEVDTTGGPRFGSLQYDRSVDLGPKEVVLTFDDGPHPKNTKRILQALDEECVKATFFPVGIWAKHVPKVMRMVADRGHTIGAHSWSHPSSFWQVRQERRVRGPGDILSLKERLRTVGLIARRHGLGVRAFIFSSRVISAGSAL